MNKGNGGGGGVTLNVIDESHPKLHKNPTLKSVKTNVTEDATNLQMQSSGIKLQRNNRKLHEELQRLKEMLDQKNAKEGSNGSNTSMGLIYSPLTESLEEIKNKMVSENK